MRISSLRVTLGPDGLPEAGSGGPKVPGRRTRNLREQGFSQRLVEQRRTNSVTSSLRVTAFADTLPRAECKPSADASEYTQRPSGSGHDGPCGGHPVVWAAAPGASL